MQRDHRAVIEGKLIGIARLDSLLVTILDDRGGEIRIAEDFDAEQFEPWLNRSVERRAPARHKMPKCDQGKSWPNVRR